MLKEFSSRPFLHWIYPLAASLLLLVPSSLRSEQDRLAPASSYPLTSDSVSHPDVPRGEILHLDLAHSRIFPATHRKLDVYVPAQYTPDKPACVYVGLDGLSFEAPTVFDNLIAAHQMPITIGIGVSPGIVDSAEGNTDPRFDRSYEFDSRNDNLARFLIQEVLPEVEGHSTRDGRKLVLSANPNDRMIGGASTGGIGAFTVAWQHPEEFRRVFTAIGTFVGMRGGESYYVEVRKTAPKPIRIFMQDGSNDQWPGGTEMGDWWMSNQTMERALTYAGYDVRHAWGTGSHNGEQAAAVFPDAMRWLWRDWPAAVPTGVSNNLVLRAILDAKIEWEAAGEVCGGDAITAGTDGRIYRWIAASQKMDALSPTILASSCSKHFEGEPAAVTAGQNGDFFVADHARRKILKTRLNQQRPRIIVAGLAATGVIASNNDNLYVTTEEREGAGEIWRIGVTGQKHLLASALSGATGLTLSPDKLWLLVMQNHSHSAMSFRVQKDGSLDSGLPFYDLHVRLSANGSGAFNAWSDTEGRPYIATSAGVQVMDRNGRVTAILPLPGGAPATSLCFGGPDFQTLYVLSGGRVYRTHLHATGAPVWRAAIKLPKWGAG